MLTFNRPPFTGDESRFISELMGSDKISGDGVFTKKCHTWFDAHLGAKNLLTTSCTHALEMSAILCDIKAGDEVIMPSYTFVSTANAFVLRGAKIVFVDIRPDTLNIDESKIEEAITPKTKAIVPVHYAGVACEMDTIMDIAKRHNLYVVEDAAQGMMASYRGKALGTIGDIGCFSFHETKNYTSGGEGGLFITHNQSFFERAEIIREKGTNRSQFFRGMVDKYSWVDVGSSYLPSELQAAYLYGNLVNATKINEDRLQSWQSYYAQLTPLREYIELPTVPKECLHNAHMFYIKVANLEVRTKLLAHLKSDDILAVFHYVPLHSSKAGLAFGRFHAQDIYTTKESERLIRLPLFYGLQASDIERVVTSIFNFFKGSR